MSILNAEEAIRFFKSYGFRVDKESVKEWVEDQNKKAGFSSGSRPIVEDDLYRYNDWRFVKGTAYEEGIDDRTKIARLLEEVTQLKMEVKNLKGEKQRLENQLGMNDRSYL
jgi:hypothetical protein